MAKRIQDRISGCIREVVSTLQLRAETDQELLQRFLGEQDESAFAAIIRRHGPMVLRVAQRTLQNEHDAEDVFQATFLVLSQKARSLRRQDSLGSWLYGIAYRLALKVKATAGERRKRQRRIPEATGATPLAQLTVQEAQTVLDEEINRLPEKLRDPVVLCCLEGLARDEAAKQIGCPESVLKSRLEQGRERLRQRLIARGLTLPCAFGAFLLLEGVAGASVPAALIVSTAKAATCVAGGKAVGSAVAAKVAALTEGAVRTMMLTKIKIAAVAILVGVMLLGSGLLTYRTLAAHSAQLAIAAEQPAAPQKQDQKPEKEDFTAWGKVVSGLQAGVGFRPGEKRAYHHGETITLVVRIRNVSKETVQFAYIKQYLDEEPPIVSDGDGKMVAQAKIEVTGLIHVPVEVSLAPGKEIVLESRIDGADAVRHTLSPVGERAGGNSRGRPLYGTGKVLVQYTQVFGSSSAGQLKLDPELSTLGTGKLELDIKPGPPPENGKKSPKKEDQKSDKEGFTAWGKETGGLQAGLGFHPGAKRAYRHGDEVALVIRVRNVSKESVKFSYLMPYIEHAPIVTDGEGKRVPQPTKFYEIGERLPGQVELEPGKEMEILELKREVRPASESGTNTPRPEGRLHALCGTGKVGVRYEQVLGDPAMGNPGWKLDPVLSTLTTGMLELDVRTPPDKKEKEGASASEKKMGTSEWGLEDAGLRCRATAITETEQGMSLDVSVEMQSVPKGLKPNVKQLDAFLVAEFMELTLTNVKTGKSARVRPYDPTGGMLASDTGKHGLPLDGAMIKPWPIRFPLVKLGTDLEPGAYECKVRFSFPQRSKFWRGTDAAWEAAGFWHGTVESGVFRVEVLKEQPRTNTFLLPKRLQLEKGLKINYTKEDAEAVELKVRNGHFVSARYLHFSDKKPVGTTMTGVPGPGDVNPISSITDYKGGDRNVSVTVEIFETADPPVHLWSPGPGSGGYRVLWSRSFDISLTEKEIREKQ